VDVIEGRQPMQATVPQTAMPQTPVLQTTLPQTDVVQNTVLQTTERASQKADEHLSP
jgi:hypothetical protein